MVIRPARPGDEAAIAAIYNEGIEDGVATFETSPRSVDDVRPWLAEGLPVIVAEHGSEVVGYARVSQYSDRCVYAGVGEHGVYVARRARGGGVGRALLAELAAAAEGAGLYKLTARIFTTNSSSLAVHRSAGFREVGVQRRHGRLDGEWRDVVLVERLLGEAARDSGP